MQLLKHWSSILYSNSG